MEKELEQVFLSAKLRLTEPRRRVFKVFINTTKPLTITEVIERCPQVDRVSVYRTVDLFRKLRVIDTVMVGWKQYYELAAPFTEHHHHIYCRDCGMVKEIHSKALEAIVQDIAEKHGFASVEHGFEITGQCEKCRDGHKSTYNEN
jgi:Fe2+ or Zn2+ uptake regulation protein